MESVGISKVLLIVNPVAGKRRSRSGLFDIVEQLCHYGCTATVQTTGGRGDATATVRRLAPEYDMVICCGGDGTLSEVVTGLIQSGADIPIGYVPAGSTNDMANNLKLPRRIREAAQTVLTGSAAGHDVGLFDGGRYFSYVASFGAFTKVSYATPQWLKNRFGHFAYILDGIRSVGDLRPYRAKVEAEGEGSFEGEYLFGSVTNSTSIAGVIKLRENEVSLHDGKFEVLLVRNPKNPDDLRRILYGVTHRKYDETHVRFFHTDHITFQFDEDIAWTLDGEYAPGGRRSEIRVLPSAVKIIR
ncbi:YegS/Rv2252/BmrU family lipid kinase [Feifania hominis]|uniref:Diacylglycerol kinase family lipid kinase n=1 Tax=Feifania hominis TaxID=2763660 RepID=A0A926DDR0_9FIRM|nr:diacylglycerol kinase family lipid kinase [Feifania hominis]